MADTPAAPGQGNTVPGTQGETQEAKAPQAPQAPAGEPEQGKTLLGGAAEGKPDAQGKTVPEGEKTAEPEKEGIPEKYEFQLPEGMEPDTKLIEEFTPLARELKLGQEGAQKLADLYAKKVAEQVQAQTEHALEYMNTDAMTAEADPEYGGDKLKVSLAAAESFLKIVDSEGKFTRHLNEKQFISRNDPELIRILVKAGQMISEDQTPGGRFAGHPKDPAEVLYPSMGKTS